MARLRAGFARGAMTGHARGGSSRWALRVVVRWASPIVAELRKGPIRQALDRLRWRMRGKVVAEDHSQDPATPRGQLLACRRCGGPAAFRVTHRVRGTFGYCSRTSGGSATHQRRTVTALSPRDGKQAQ